MKELKCKDLGMKCKFVAIGATKGAVKKQMAAHGMKVHGEEMAKMTKVQMDKMDKKMNELLSE
jgi:predicted small metal-binding protein